MSRLAVDKRFTGLGRSQLLELVDRLSVRNAALRDALTALLAASPETSAEARALAEALLATPEPGPKDVA